MEIPKEMKNKIYKAKEMVSKSLKRLIILLNLKSLESAVREQGLYMLRERLRGIVPDITNQYTLFKIDNPYLEANVRNMHAFQISLVDRIMPFFRSPTIVDIGDSAGTHLQYIMSIYNKTHKINSLSVNLDKDAVARIKNKGLNAVNARAEELEKYNILADIFLCFEILEHLSDPVNFLHNLSINTKAQYIVLTVPYLKKSRVSLLHIRNNQLGPVHAENTHLFELSPEDWKLLMRHAGWDVFAEKIYLQYPLRNPYRLTKYLWRKYDFEGFYGVILKRDTTWSSKYLDW